MVPLNMTHLHCLQHSFFEHLFNLYWHDLRLGGIGRVVPIAHCSNDAMIVFRRS